MSVQQKTRRTMWQGLAIAGLVGFALVGAGGPTVSMARKSTGESSTAPASPMSPQAAFELISVSSSEAQGNGASGNNDLPNAVSEDGRYVMFISNATNLAPGDTGTDFDVFVRDRTDGTTEMVSVSNTGAQANSQTMRADMSDDGRYVIFLSEDDTLVPGDNHPGQDIFIRDRVADTTQFALPGIGGTPEFGFGADKIAISGNGRYIAFHTYGALSPEDEIGVRDIYVYDRDTGDVDFISNNNSSTARGHSFNPSISDDGRYVAYHSMADDLVGGDTNEHMDLFVFDRETRQTERVSLTQEGGQTNNDSLEASISNDGRFVSYTSEASNIAPQDTDANQDIYVFDRQTDTTRLVSLRSDETRPVPGNAGVGSRDSQVSGNGRYVTFQSDLQLDPGDTNFLTDIYVRDLVAGTTEWTSRSGGGYNYAPAINDDGRYVAFSSTSDRMAANDTNDKADIFLADRSPSCEINFSDVAEGSTFYPYIRCLACAGVLGGYGDNTFRPGDNVTRGQLSKIVANAANFNEPVSGQSFSDVPPSSPFYLYVERMARRGYIGGYPDDTFRPGAFATRGQIAKIVSNAAGYNDTPTGQTFPDVPPDSPFYLFVERVAAHGAVGGYSDGTFRPGVNTTRGQVSKIVSVAFFPGCTTP